MIEATSDLLAVKRSEVLHELRIEMADRDAVSSFPVFELTLDDDELGLRRGPFVRKLRAK